MTKNEDRIGVPFYPKPKKLKFKLGEIVELVFWDHSEGGEPHLFSVWGRVGKASKVAVTVDVWAYANPRHERDENVASYTIIRKAIEDKIELAEREPD